jgi:uncharacterized protein involved in exopolysaccharide biosynthesis
VATSALQEPLVPDLPANTDIFLTDLIATIALRWKLFAFCCLLPLGAATLIAFTATPVYRAEAIVFPVANDSSNFSLSSLASQIGPIAGIDFGSAGERGKRDVWLATLNSNSTLRGFIREQTSLPELFPDRWDPVAKIWKRGLFGRSHEPSINEGVALIKRKILSIDSDSRTKLVTIAFEWRDPVAAARWANKLVEMTNSTIRENAISENKRSIKFLEEELDKTNAVERRQIIYRLIESRAGEIMIANGRPEYAFSIIDAAIAPDRGRYISPNRPLIMALGLILGVFAGILICTMLGIVHRSSKEALR